MGGTLAAGWLGPRRHCYGRLRDYLIGSTIVLADGTIARAGGMVVKNVAGYDMSRLYVGSFGTLGVLVQANLKTIPLPPHARLFLASLPERTRERACAQLAALRIPPAAAFWIDGFQAIDGDAGAEGRILAILEGSAALLERATLELRSALGRAGVPETRVIEAGARESFERVVDVHCLLGRTLRDLSSLSACGGVAAARARPARAHAAVRASQRNDRRRDEWRRRAARERSRHAFVRSQDRAFDDALHEAEPHAQVVASGHPHRMYLRVWGTDPPAVDRMRATQTSASIPSAL